jgi:iron-sulfur cluster insertion protein
MRVQKSVQAYVLVLFRDKESIMTVETALPIEFSDSAAAKVKELVSEEENPELKLRVYVTGGGCSGFQYGFTFDEKINEGDLTINKDQVTLVVDPMSLQYLVGGTVDYVDNLDGARFLVNNPNATTTCGCGASFSV